MAKYAIGLDYGTLSVWALQHPKDYINGLIYTVTNVMKNSTVKPEEVIGIGVDFTSSTIFPVRADGCPLCFTKEFEREPHAYAKLWKHHGADKEATYIDQIVKERGEDWLSYCGVWQRCKRRDETFE